MGASTGEMDGGTGAFHCTIQIEVLSFGLASQRLPGESEMALLQNQKRRRRSSPKIPLTGRTVVRDRMTGVGGVPIRRQQFCPLLASAPPTSRLLSPSILRSTLHTLLLTPWIPARAQSACRTSALEGQVS